jgi:hypothetical protein
LLINGNKIFAEVYLSRGRKTSKVSDTIAKGLLFKPLKRIFSLLHLVSYKDIVLSSCF